MPEIKDRDPYTPPPMHRDRSGAVLRVAILAALLGAAGLGYVWMSGQPQTALVPEMVEERQVAEAGYQVPPETDAAAVPPTSAPAAAPQPRRSAPVERTPDQVTEPTPAPEQAPAAPNPPVDMPPDGTVGSP